jgi:hypothetical protein
MSSRIGPADPRYLALVQKRFNKRFTARPDCIRQVSSTDQVVSAVAEAVKEERRLVATSGGHCLEGFVSDPEVRVILRPELPAAPGHQGAVGSPRRVPARAVDSTGLIDAEQLSSRPTQA